MGPRRICALLGLEEESPDDFKVHRDALFSARQRPVSIFCPTRLTYETSQSLLLTVAAHCSIDGLDDRVRAVSVAINDPKILARIVPYKGENQESGTHRAGFVA